MELLFGTCNQAKLEVMQSRLSRLNIEIIGLRDMAAPPPQVPENGRTLLENARQKALAYYRTYHRPVFSCDTGLYFEGVPEEIQPGVHVRTVGGKYLTDGEMLAYYAGLAEKYGGLKARYRNAVCLVMDEEHIYERMDESMASRPFLITSTPCSGVRRKGFPLDSLSRDIKTGRYFYEMEEEQVEQAAVQDGVLKFFQEVLGKELPGIPLEFLDVVDEQGSPVGEIVERKRAHREGVRHRTAHVWLLRRKGERTEILLQKRSPVKDSFPGCYDISSAGHIPAGVDYIPSALRELWEELGVRACAEALHYCGKRFIHYEEEFYGEPFVDNQVSNVYFMWMDREPEDFVLQREEVQEVKWFGLEECMRLVEHNAIPHCIMMEELNMVKAASSAES